MWGCGPVGQFAIESAYLLGAERVIAIDQVAERLEMARTQGKAETIDFSQEHVLERLRELTGGRDPDACIDAIGLEAHGHSIDAIADRVKAATRVLESDRPHIFCEEIMACRKGSTVSVPGVYGSLLDKMPMSAAFAKGLTFKMGLTHVRRYLSPLFDLIEQGKIGPSFVITHRRRLEDATAGYDPFANHEDRCSKIVMQP